MKNYQNEIPTYLPHKSCINLTKQKLNTSQTNKEYTQKEIAFILDAYFDTIKEVLCEGYDVKTPVATFKVVYVAPQKAKSTGVSAQNEKCKVKTHISFSLVQKLKKQEIVDAIKSKKEGKGNNDVE